MLLFSSMERPEIASEENLSDCFDLLLFYLNHIIRSYRILFKDIDAHSISRLMLPAFSTWRIVRLADWDQQDGLFILHLDVPFNREVLSEEAGQQLTWYAMVSLEQVNPFMSAVELQLDDHGWAKLTVPGSDGKSSTTTRKAELENNELKLTGGDAEIMLGKLVDFNSRQMVLERSGSQVTFVRP